MPRPPMCGSNSLIGIEILLRNYKACMPFVNTEPSSEGKSQALGLLWGFRLGIAAWV
jgi:hypothetical protein